MSVLNNPTFKSVLQILVVLAVLGGVAYLIYHFMGKSQSGDVTTTTTMVTEHDMHQVGMEGFAGCPARNQEGFDSMPPVERNVEEAFTDPEPALQQQQSESKPLASDNTLGMNQMPSECYPKDVLSSVDLLPSDANSHYAIVNPNGQGALSDQNFLTAGYHIGINTVGQTLRNANRQLRSDPPCPQVAVSPWNNTTIEYDGNRRPLEIGGAP